MESIKSIVPLVLGILLVAFACNKKTEEAKHDHAVAAPQAQVDTVKKSIPKEEHVQVGSAHVMIKYHAPAVRGRNIWGGLVTLGEVWVTGAHSATSLETDKDLRINGQIIPAGKYALFTIPNQDQWTMIINKNWDQHLADEYDQKDDVLRMDVKPQLFDQVQERLKWSVIPANETSGSITMRWEKVKVEMPFEVVAK